jgi:uncharacterized Fe-S center protein
MRSTVYVADLRATAKESVVDKIGYLVDTAGLSDCLKKRDLTAVKLHFGELGEDKFSGLYPKVDWKIQLEYAQQLGLGRRDYRIQKNMT